MKKETVADLLSAYADKGGPDCESIETLHGWVTGELPTQRAAQVESHVSSCARCAAEARLAGWFEQPEESAQLDTVAAALSQGGGAERLAATGGVLTSSRWWARPWVSGALAVAATLVIVAGLTVFRQPPPVGELPAADVVRGAAPTIVEPRGVLNSAPASVGWQGDANARYRVALMAVDDSVLWSAEVEGERVELPAEARAMLVERVTYRLRVTPVAPDSTPAGPGDEVEFRIVGDRP